MSGSLAGTLSVGISCECETDGGVRLTFHASVVVLEEEEGAVEPIQLSLHTVSEHTMVMHVQFPCVGTATAVPA